jgi:hypothetical protein
MLLNIREFVENRRTEGRIFPTYVNDITFTRVPRYSLSSKTSYRRKDKGRDGCDKKTRKKT